MPASPPLSLGRRLAGSSTECASKVTGALDSAASRSAPTAPESSAMSARAFPPPLPSPKPLSSSSLAMARSDASAAGSQPGAGIRLAPALAPPPPPRLALAAFKSACSARRSARKDLASVPHDS